MLTDRKTIRAVGCFADMCVVTWRDGLFCASKSELFNSQQDIKLIYEVLMAGLGMQGLLICEDNWSRNKQKRSLVGPVRCFLGCCYIAG